VATHGPVDGDARAVALGRRTTRCSVWPGRAEVPGSVPFETALARLPLYLIEKPRGHPAAVQVLTLRLGARRVLHARRRCLLWRRRGRPGGGLEVCRGDPTVAAGRGPQSGRVQVLPGIARVLEGGLPSFRTVVYRSCGRDRSDIRDGGQLKYISVKPGADPSRIGCGTRATRVALSARRTAVETAGGTLEDGAPVEYQRAEAHRCGCRAVRAGLRLGDATPTVGFGSRL